jgi:hypothetical protein
MLSSCPTLGKKISLKVNGHSSRKKRDNRRWVPPARKKLPLYKRRIQKRLQFTKAGQL